MKKIVFCLAFVCFFCLTPPSVWAEQETLLVFAGAGMRGPLEEIGEIFQEEFGVQVVYDFEGSGRLGNKILAGQQPDVFIPGSTKWAKKLEEKETYIQQSFQLTYHIPVIITPLEQMTVNSVQDLALKDVRLVLGDYDAAAIGKVGGMIFKNAGLDESGLNVVSRGITVKQLVQWIEMNVADASIVWQADAVQSGEVRIVPIPEKLNTIAVVPVCTMKQAPHPEQTERYIHYLLGPGKAIFEKHGFVTER